MLQCQPCIHIRHTRTPMKILSLPLAKPLWHLTVRACPRLAVPLFYNAAVGGGKKLELNNPRDINQKIQWLKLHADQHEWARLADKYAVRQYVKDRGLEDILVPLYGKWDTADALMAGWEGLPDQFVLKTNNSCGTIILVKDKQTADKQAIRKQLGAWLAMKNVGIRAVELHYRYIRPCIIAEQLLQDPTVAEFSRSLIDYKIWAFDGRPHSCFLAYDRDITRGTHIFDVYDLDWQEHTEYMSDAQVPRHPVPRPPHYKRMLEVAAILSKGHPQMRVDLYNVGGQIYFGECTMTAQGGYMDYFTDDFLEELGRQCHLPIDP